LRLALVLKKEIGTEKQYRPNGETSSARGMISKIVSFNHILTPALKMKNE